LVRLGAVDRGRHRLAGAQRFGGGRHLSICAQLLRMLCRRVLAALFWLNGVSGTGLVRVGRCCF
jgi:hypothetical protein